MTTPLPTGDPALTALVLDNIDRAVIALDRDGQITLFNPAAEAYLGRAARHVLGRHFEELFAGQEALLYLVRAALRDGRSITDDESIFLQRPKAAPLPVSVYAAPIFSRRGEQDGAVLIIRDLSRVRELEETLRRADQLAMLATLAAGLAHEIKNPLGGIKGAAQLLAMELRDDSPLREYTRVMVKETERINGIIEELMDLGKPRPALMGEVNLARILGDIVLLQKEAARGQRIDFVLSLDPSIPPVQGDEHLLTRLFLNLIKNAREAIGPRPDRDRIENLGRISHDHPRQPAVAAGRGADPRHRLRHRGGRTRTDLHPLLHDQEHRERAGAGDLPEDRGRPPRLPETGEHPRRGHGNFRLAAAAVVRGEG